MSTPVLPTAAQVAVTNTQINALLGRAQTLVGQIGYLQNAAANLTAMQAELAAIESQLITMGYTGPMPS